MNPKIILLFILVIFLGTSCTSDTTKGGGTETGDPGAIETNNGGLIGGKAVLDTQGVISLENAVVWSDDKIEKQSRTNNSGDYTITNLSEGKYVVYAKWKYNGILLMGRSEEIDIGNPKSSQKPYIYLGQSILMSEPAQLQGMIINHIPSASTKKMQVRLRKTIFNSNVQNNGVIELNDVPAGKYTLEILLGFSVVYVKEIELKSGETLDLGLLNVP